MRSLGFIKSVAPLPWSFKPDQAFKHLALLLICSIPVALQVGGGGRSNRGQEEVEAGRGVAAIAQVNLASRNFMVGQCNIAGGVYCKRERGLIAL